MEPEHANDPDNQDTSNVSSDPQTQVPEKPPRSKLERSIVWSVIGLLLVLTGMEGLAQYGYRKTLTNLETAIAETKKPLTLEDFNGEIRKGLPIVTSGVREGGEKTILYKWPSLLKQYELHLTIKPGDQILLTYSTGDGPAGLIGTPGKPGNSEGGEDEETAPGGGDGGAGDGGAGGGAGGGGGRRGARNPLQRLVSASIVAELNLTDDQKTEIEDLVESQPSAGGQDLTPEERAQQSETRRKEAQAKLKEILDEKQFSRARQILLHARGPEALTQDDVAEELKLSDEQREQIAAIITTNREQRGELFQKAQSGEIERGQIREKMAELNSKTNEQVLAVLTDEQKQAWEQLLGPAPPEPERGNRRRPE